MAADKRMPGDIFPVMHCLRQAIKGFKAFIAGLILRMNRQAGLEMNFTFAWLILPFRLKISSQNG
jgi:hypothetical protein